MASPTWPRRLARWALDLALILAVVLGVQWWKAAPLARGPAPPLAGRTLEGRPADLRDLRGTPALIHFWATWCPACTLVNDTIAHIAQDHRVLTVAMQSGGPGEVQAFMAEAGLVFPVIADETGAMASGWGVQGVPASFILDGDGRIAYATAGVSTELGLRARLWAAGHLNRGAVTGPEDPPSIRPSPP